jgi:hypothetical protein
MSFIQGNYEIKTLGVAVQTPVTPYTLFTFNLVAGRKYKVTMNFPMTLFIATGLNRWAFAVKDSGNQVGSQFVHYEDLSSAAFVAAGFMSVTKYITMDPVGTGVLTVDWDAYTLAGSGIYVDGTTEAIVEEITQQETSNW